MAALSQEKSSSREQRCSQAYLDTEAGVSEPLFKTAYHVACCCCTWLH